MVDTKIPNVNPGIASFATETFGGPDEPRFGDAHATTTIVKVGGNVDLPVYSVVTYDGATIVLAKAGNKDAYGILTAGVITDGTQTTTVAVYRSGDWDMEALNWDATFDTDDKKSSAFEKSLSPTVFIQKSLHSDDAIRV